MRILLSVFLFASMSLNTDEPLPGGQFMLTDVKVQPIERTRLPNGKINDHVSDILTHWIRFDVHPKFERKEAAGFQIADPVVSAKQSVTLDKAIRHKGKPVAAGTNLMSLKKFNGRTFNISMPNLNPFAIGSIRLSDDFEFPPDTYTFTFGWETKSGRKIAKEVKVKVDLEK